MLVYVCSVGLQCWHAVGEHAGALEHQERFLLLPQKDGTRWEVSARSTLLQSSRGVDIHSPIVSWGSE